MYHIPFHEHFKSCFPAANTSHHSEPVATDTIFSDEPALGSNTATAQIFIGLILSTSISMELLLIVISLTH